MNQIEMSIKRCKTVLGLDLGTNSIGWAIVQKGEKEDQNKILGMGSRIVPMDSDLIKGFEEGNSITKSAERRRARGARRNRFRYKLRRNRLITVLKNLNWLSADFQPGFAIPVSDTSAKELESLFDGEKVPADWVNYYLRKKGLTEELTGSELSRVLLQFNNRRGFKSNRKSGDIELPPEFTQEEKFPKYEKTVEEVRIQSIEPLIEDGKQKFIRKKPVFELKLQDGRKGEIIRSDIPDWENEEMELEITVKTVKSGNQSILFSEADKSDWQRRKEAFDKKLEEANKYPGSFLLEELIRDRNYKVRGRVIERRRLREELQSILNKQEQFHPELLSMDLRKTVSKRLYEHNKQKQNEIHNQSLSDTLLDDIIFFQRPLKTKKATINKCRFETINIPDADSWELKPVGVNSSPVSAPLYQEFRIWQTIHNLRIIETNRKTKNNDGKEITEPNFDVTDELFPAGKEQTEFKESLFELFDSAETVKQKDVLKVLGLSQKEFRWNYPINDDKFTLKGNETKHHFRKVFKKHNFNGDHLLNEAEKLHFLWHLVYSLENPVELNNALKRHFELPHKVAIHLSLANPFKSNYGAFSTRAVKKLISVMRIGKHWSYKFIPTPIKKRVQDLITAEVNPDLPIDLRERLKKLDDEGKFQGLPLHLASYVVYGRHSEVADDTKLQDFPMDDPERLEKIQKEVESLIVDQQELRNPIVTQMVNETIRLVGDAWNEYGRPDRIHLELSREMQKNAKEREKMTEGMSSNRNDRERARGLLREMRKGNPNSKKDIDKLLLWEELAPPHKKEELRNLRWKKLGEPTKAEIEKYRLWFEQGFRSPYSGNFISFEDLFGPHAKCDVDHVIPRRRFFDDSFANKVVVELELNREKDKRTAYEYILNGSAKNKLMSRKEFEDFVNSTFSGKKRELLLSEDIPKKFTERQLVDTRYIGRMLNSRLSRVASDPTDPIIVSSGRITNELKESWGLHEVMKEVIRWRFQRMEIITGKDWDYGKNEGDHLKLKGYSKRFDHRHHALDALAVACTTRSHIQYLNNLNKTFKDDEERMRYSLLLAKDKRGNLKARKFAKPWPKFTEEAKTAMGNIVVSHKNRNRILNKGVNWYRKFVEKDGQWVKEKKKQTKGKLWSARQPLSAGTNRGIVQIKEKKEVSLKEALKNVDFVSGKKIRKQLQGALKKHDGKQIKALKWLEEHPVIGYDGRPQKQFWIVPKEKQNWPVQEACWFLDSIVDPEVKTLVQERWEKCNRSEHLYRLSLELEPLKNGSVVSEVEIETYPLKSVNRVDLLHNSQSPWSEKKLSKITDRNLSKQLIEHLKTFEVDEKKGSAIAFSSEGIEAFSKKWGKPIKSVRIYEDIGNKYPLNGTYVETAKGTNLYFAVYEHMKSAKRKYKTISLMVAMNRKMQDFNPAPEEPDHRLVQTLSPNDTVYAPAEDEDVKLLDFTNIGSLKGGFYKFISSSDYTPYFLPIPIADVIEKKVEFETMNKSERTVEIDGSKGRMIKEIFVKVNVDRIGNIQYVPELS